MRYYILIDVTGVIQSPICKFSCHVGYTVLLATEDTLPVRRKGSHVEREIARLADGWRQVGIPEFVSTCGHEVIGLYECAALPTGHWGVFIYPTQETDLVSRNAGRPLYADHLP
jgi:hypothetical protein